MLRFKILALVVPLAIAAVFARGGWSVSPHPCIDVGNESVEIASIPWHADLHVSFTDDPAAATVRVQILDSAEAADFAVVDDIDNPKIGAPVTGAPESGACEATAATPQRCRSRSRPAVWVPRPSSISPRMALRITGSS
jgi:hypothetical protein